MQAHLVSLHLCQLPEEILDDSPCVPWPFVASYKKHGLKQEIKSTDF